MLPFLGLALQLSFLQHFFSLALLTSASGFLRKVLFITYTKSSCRQFLWREMKVRESLFISLLQGNYNAAFVNTEKSSNYLKSNSFCSRGENVISLFVFFTAVFCRNQWIYSSLWLPKIRKKKTSLFNSSFFLF